jgi:hypothetical protein
MRSLHSSVGIAAGYVLDDPGSFPDSESLFYGDQIGSDAHRASYPMGTGGSFPKNKAVGT